MTGAQLQGDMDGVMTYMHEFYFESAAMIVTLITVGKMRSTLQGAHHRRPKRPYETGSQDGHAYKKRS